MKQLLYKCLVKWEVIGVAFSVYVLHVVVQPETYIDFWDRLYVLELQLYFAFCRQQVENKAVETNPANSNLAADDMSAMKYVSLFFFSFCFFYKKFSCIL
jgi:hypothetical protein